MFEYLASVQSAVRRVNNRISTLAEKFGEHSSLINNIASKYEVIFGDNMRYKDGVPQLVKPSEIFDDEYLSQVLQAEDNTLRTWGSYRKQYEDTYNRYVNEENFFNKEPVKMPDFIQTLENIHHALLVSDSEQLPQDAVDILRVKNRRNTYDELNKVSAILKEKGFL